ncbi:MAG: tetratricopeptide repeat protein [Candidatus Omnitrophica bacterium]|nr:tetratricopeptide repeat protein [Candidatus Omnitrophota bacterium]
MAATAVVAEDETVPTETQYAAIQQAFLQEEFGRVAALVPPILADAFLEPKTVRIWLWLILSEDRLQRGNHALMEVDRLKTSLSDLPSTPAVKAWTESVWPEILYWEGEVSRKALKMVRARLAYQRLLGAFPTSVWQAHARLGLGLVYFHEQAYADAQQQFAQVARASPRSSLAQQASVLEGASQLHAKRFEDAAAHFRQVLEQPLDQALRGQVSFYLGEALTGVRRFAEASQAYRQALELDPRAPWATGASFGLGWSEFQQGRCRESLEAFEQSRAARAQLAQDERVPGSARAAGEALFAQGRCLMELRQDSQALARFEELRQQHAEDPLVVDATLSAAELLQRLQRDEEALALLRLLAVRPLEPVQRTQWQLRMGACWLAQGDAAKAREAFEQAQQTADDTLRQAAVSGLGDAALLLGQHDEAARWYRQARAIAPAAQGAFYAAYQLGRVTLQQGRTEDAVAVFRALLDQTTDQAFAVDVRLALAFAAIAQRQPDRARAELALIRRQHPTPSQAARITYDLALLALSEGRPLEAKQFCEEVIRLAPQTDEALDARLLLTDLVANQASPQEAFEALRAVFAQTGAIPRRQRGTLARKAGEMARRALDYAQAIHWYELAWEELPAQRGELDYQVASCYEEGGDLGLAIWRYRAILHPPWQIRGQLAIAKLMEREEQWQEARRVYEGVAGQAAPEAKVAQERLASLSDLPAAPAGEAYPVRTH